MAAFSRTEIMRYLAAADAATTPDARGKYFEELICHLFQKIRGVTLPQRNVLDSFASEEIDIAFFNEQHPKGLKAFDPFLLIECKNWSSTVGSVEVGAFISKLRNRGLEFGILVAANGITGSVDDGKHAHHQVALALKDGIRIIVITRAEIENLTGSDELVTLIKKKVIQLLASGTVWP